MFIIVCILYKIIYRSKIYFISIKYLIILISAQQEGSLSEATSPETDQTDPFYAHCKLHVDKLVAKLVYLF